MGNKEQLEILKRGHDVWNKWRENNADVMVDLTWADLSYMRLEGVYLEGVNLKGADLAHANLSCTSFSGADFTDANLKSANLSDANLTGVNLTRANLEGANLTGSYRAPVDISFFYHSRTTLADANLFCANFDGAECEGTIFANNDLSQTKNLDRVIHRGPSEISISTLYKSAGGIPEAFLRGCGVPDEFITFLPSIIGAQQAIQFYSCFVSYSTKDDEFARRLYSRMRDENLRVWFAPEDIKGGKKMVEQLERAIQLHDRLLLVISDHSIHSEWVMTEIRKARRAEVTGKRRKLFPIRLVDFERIKEWECFDADTGKDLAVEVREYYIPDFSNWKDHDVFEASFERLLRDLKAEESGGRRA
jgi:hypothetical protein